jgi:hypothetical protein
MNKDNADPDNVKETPADLVGIVADSAGMMESPTGIMESPTGIMDGPEQSEPSIVGELVDKLGNAFDSAIHQTTKDGRPLVTKTGKLARRPGNKAGSNGHKSKLVIPPTPGASTGGPATPAPDAAAKSSAGRLLAARAAASTLISAGIWYGGDEWRPYKGTVEGRDIDERQSLINAFDEYFAAKEIDDFPPGIALTITVWAYAAPRVTMQGTANRTKSLWGRFKLWLVKRKLAKDENRKNALHNDRTNGEREDNAGQETL